MPVRPVRVLDINWGIDHRCSLSLLTNLGSEVSLGPIRYLETGAGYLGFMPDEYEVHAEATFVGTIFYYQGRQINRGLFNSPCHARPGDAVTIQHRINTNYTDPAAFLTAFIIILDAGGRVAWREVFECLNGMLPELVSQNQSPSQLPSPAGIRIQ